MKIVTKDDHVYVIRRNYYRDSQKQRGSETREHVGKIAKDCFYTIDEYRRHFKRNSEPRVFPKQGKIKSRVKATKQASSGTFSNTNVDDLNKVHDAVSDATKSQLALDTASKSNSSQTTIPTKDKPSAAYASKSSDQSSSVKSMVEAKLCGEVMLLDTLAEQIHLKEDLVNVCGE